MNGVATWGLTLFYLFMTFISLYYQFTHGSFVPFYFHSSPFPFAFPLLKLKLWGFFAMRLVVNEANVYPFALRTKPWRIDWVQKLLCANNIIQYIYYNHNNCKLHLISRRNGKSFIFFVFRLSTFAIIYIYLYIDNWIGNLHDQYMAIRFVHSIWSISFLFLKLIFYFFCFWLVRMCIRITTGWVSVGSTHNNIFLFLYHSTTIQMT